MDPLVLFEAALSWSSDLNPFVGADSETIGPDRLTTITGSIGRVVTLVVPVLATVPVS